jgi:hypothetical protein
MDVAPANTTGRLSMKYPETQELESPVANTKAFLLKHRSTYLSCIVDVNNENWEHVSVSVPGNARCPTWEEMCFIKDTFWNDEDCVVQFHPPKSQYVNVHPYVLHLWRHKHINFLTPRDTHNKTKEITDIPKTRYDYQKS